VNDCEAGDNPTAGATDPYPSNRIVQAFPAGSTILDVNLKLNGLTHSFPDDVDVLLSKGELARTVMSDVGGSDAVASIILRLDDEAATSLPDEALLTSGRFKPTNKPSEEDRPDEFPRRASLSGFDGLSPNGTWRLRVFDDSQVDCGRLEQGWSLTIRASVP
jgi:hypothetical protein